MINLKTLDCKTRVNFFEDDYKIKNNNTDARKYTIDNHTIWTINNFLSSDECSSIINTCETSGFDYVEWRNSSRLMTFEDNKKLENIIKSRLKEDCFLQRLNNFNHVKPYGFHSDIIQWDDNTDYINNCFRINKYSDNQGFYAHRDAQYTKNESIKSNYTLLVYLNDDFSDGETVFYVPLSEYINNGYLVREELKKFPFVQVPFKPCKGMAVIFDQRLIHKGSNVGSGNKYVLRTDLICKGEKLIDCDFVLEQDVYKLCKGIFRQAQYQELDETLINETSKLYEICIALRQTPQLISEYPKHLEKYLVNTCKVTINIDPILTFVSRNGLQYKFTYINNVSLDKETLVKVAYLYAIISCTNPINKFTEEEIATKLKKVCDLYGVYKNLDAKHHLPPDHDKELINYISNPESKFEDYVKLDLYPRYSKEKKSYPRDNKLQMFHNKYISSDRYSTPDIVSHAIDQEYYTTKRTSDIDDIKVIPELVLGKFFNIDINIPKLNTRKMNHRCPYSIYLKNTVNHAIGISPLCGICNHNSQSNTIHYSKPPINMKMISNVKYEYDKNDDNLKFDIYMSENDCFTSGDITISVLSEAINHASCQCDTYFSPVKTDVAHTIVELCGSFVLTDETLEITLTPQIIM